MTRTAELSSRGRTRTSQEAPPDEPYPSRHLGLGAPGTLPRVLQLCSVLEHWDNLYSPPDKGKEEPREPNTFDQGTVRFYGPPGIGDGGSIDADTAL
jgi:hypothetical protein